MKKVLTLAVIGMVALFVGVGCSTTKKCCGTCKKDAPVKCCGTCKPEAKIAK